MPLLMLKTRIFRNLIREPIFEYLTEVTSQRDQ
jgi:hypothetical protein